MKPTENLKRRVANMKLKNKIIAAIILAVALVSLSTAAGSRYIISTYNRLLYHATAESLARIAVEIEAGLKAVSSLSDYIIADSVIQATLEELNGNNTALERGSLNNRIYQKLSSYFSFNSSIISISVLLGDNAVAIGSDSSQESPEVLEKIREGAAAADGRVFWISSGRKDSSILCARTIRLIRNLDLRDMGILVVRVNFGRIVNSALSAVRLSSSEPTFAVLAQDQVIYPVDGQGMEAFASLVNPQKAYDIVKLEGANQFIVNQPMAYMGWNYVSLSPYNAIFNSIMVSHVLFFASLAAAVTLAIVLSGMLIGSITRHFDVLLLKMASFKKGEMKPLDTGFDYSSRHDEVGVLHQQFDDMIREIAYLIEDNYVKQLLIKDTRLKMLEQQINPHFLYNTLETINWRAKYVGEKNISMMVEALGNLLRAAISEKSDVIPLSRELSILESYIRIQQIRFEERLTYTQSVDEALLNRSVPKMSIQPLVENAIKYSLETVAEACTIGVTIGAQDERVVIRVENDGSVIDVEVLEKLRSGNLKPHGHGIGLENIDSRIKLIYGEEYGLTFENTNGRAAVQMTLPYETPEELKARYTHAETHSG